MADAMSRGGVEPEKRLGGELAMVQPSVCVALYALPSFPPSNSGSFQSGRRAARPPLGFPINERAERRRVSPVQPLGVTVSQVTAGPGPDDVQRAVNLEDKSLFLSQLRHLLFGIFIFIFILFLDSNRLLPRAQNLFSNMTGSWTAYLLGEGSRSPVLPGVAGFVLACLLWRVVRAWLEYRVRRFLTYGN